MIIDFHTHTFPKSISHKALESLSINGHVKYFTDASIEALTDMMKKSNVDYSVTLPVMTRPDQVIMVNDGVLRTKDELFDKGIISFGGLHPDFSDFKQEIRRLKESGIKGIKFHPAFQGISINDIKYKRMIDEISACGMITLVHCGIDVGFMDENFASVRALIDLIDDVHPDKLVLAHMGGWQAWDEVERELAGADVWLDTAFSLGPYNAREGEDELTPYKYNLTKNDFLRLVRKHGAKKVLFATDCPWAVQKDYVEFIEETDLTLDEKRQIFYENAASLLQLV